MNKNQQRFFLETVNPYATRMSWTERGGFIVFSSDESSLLQKEVEEGGRLRLQTTYVRSPTLYRMRTRYHGNFQLPDRLWFQTRWQDRSAKIIVCRGWLSEIIVYRGWLRGRLLWNSALGGRSEYVKRNTVEDGD